MNKNTFIQDLWTYIKQQQGGLYTINNVVVFSLITYVVIIIKRQCYNKFGSSNKTFHRIFYAFIESIYIPTLLLICITFITDEKNIIMSYLDETTLSYIVNIKKISHIWLTWLSLVRFIQKFKEISIQQNLFKNKSLLKFITTAISTFVYIIMLLMLLSALGIPTNTLFLTGSAPVIAIGIALKDTLTNFVTGIMVTTEGNFKIGDNIYIPDKKISGNVIKIGLRTTVIKTADNNFIYVPNTVFPANSLINYSASQSYCISNNIFLPAKYYKQIPTIINQIKEFIVTLDKVDLKQSIIVECNKVNENGRLILYWSLFTNDKKLKSKISQDIFLKVIGIVFENGCNIF